MKGYLIDENLPADLRLPTAFHSTHVTDISQSPSDTMVWQHAKDHQMVIVTKDADFSHRILATEPPPWIVHVRLGNLRLKPFAQYLNSVWPTVESLLPKHKMISIFPDRIEGVE